MAGIDETSIEIDAPPAQVYELVSDVTNMGRWSPECHRCEWMGSASRPAVGSKFKGHNKRGVMRWSTTSTVVEANEPAHFAWQVDQSGMRWGYRFEPLDGGSRTKVIEYRHETSPLPAYVRIAYKLHLLGSDPDAIVRRGMDETLQRLKAGAETPSPS